jgi:hypothetical protein
MRLLALLARRTPEDASVNSHISYLCLICYAARSDHRPVLELKWRNAPKFCFTTRQIANDEAASLLAFLARDRAYAISGGPTCLAWSRRLCIFVHFVEVIVGAQPPLFLINPDKRERDQGGRAPTRRPYSRHLMHLEWDLPEVRNPSWLTPTISS